MDNLWTARIRQNMELAFNNEGPTLVNVVSGNGNDAEFWSQQLSLTSQDVFRADGDTTILSTLEPVRKGSFLGVLNAWKCVREQLTPDQIPDLTLMSLVFGQGARFSPFTQAEGNRKSAFWTPMKARTPGVYMSAGDLSNLSTNIWVQQLRRGGFHGLIVKWGDELIIPGVEWPDCSYHDVDAFRCVGKVEMTETLAREKDWVVVDPAGCMQYQFMRQDLSSLRRRLAELGSDYELRINLGSLAISYSFLQAATAVFQKEVRDPHIWIDWDPYVWLALCCKNEAQWRAEAAYEQGIGKTGIQSLESRFPNFYPTIREWRTTFESTRGRPLKIGTLEFGDSFWIDLGLHVTLRQNMELLHADSERGKTIRSLFDIPEDRDKNGNIILRSTVPAGADICDSVIIDSVITDRSSIVHQGQVIHSKHHKLSMPYGGTSLFCAAGDLEFAGPHGIAYKVTENRIAIPEGGRLCTLFLSAGPLSMASSELIVDYSGDHYAQPILGNPLSFEEAGRIMGREKGFTITSRWLEAWSSWR